MKYQPILVDKNTIYKYSPMHGHGHHDPMPYHGSGVPRNQIIMASDPAVDLSAMSDEEKLKFEQTKERDLFCFEQGGTYVIFERILRALDRFSRQEDTGGLFAYSTAEIPVLEDTCRSRLIPATGPMEYAEAPEVRVLPMAAIEDVLYCWETSSMDSIATSILLDIVSPTARPKVIGIEYNILEDFLVLAPVYKSGIQDNDEIMRHKRIWLIASGDVTMISASLTFQDGFLDLVYSVDFGRYSTDPRGNQPKDTTRLLKVPFEEYNRETNLSNPLLLGTLTKDAILGAVNMNRFSGDTLSKISRLFKTSRLLNEGNACEAIEELYMFCSLEQFITDLYEVAVTLKFWDTSHRDRGSNKVLRMNDYQYRSDKGLYIRNLLKLLNESICLRLKRQVLSVLKYPETYWPSGTASTPIQKLMWAVKFLNKYARPYYDISMPTVTCAALSGKVPGLDKEGFTVLGIPPMFPTYEGMAEEDRCFLEDYTIDSARWKVMEMVKNPAKTASRIKVNSTALYRATNDSVPLILDLGKDGKVVVLSKNRFSDFKEGRVLLPGHRIIWRNEGTLQSIYATIPGVSSGIVKDAATVVAVLKKLNPVSLKNLVKGFLYEMTSNSMVRSSIGTKYEHSQSGTLPGITRCDRTLRVMHSFTFPVWEIPGNDLFARIFKAVFLSRTSGDNDVGTTAVFNDPSLAWGIYVLKGIWEGECSEFEHVIEEDAVTWDIVNRYYSNNRR